MINQPKPVSTGTERIRNVKSFTKAYLESKSGEKALTRQSYRDKSGKNVWQSPAMAHAFKQALG